MGKDKKYKVSKKKRMRKDEGVRYLYGDQVRKYLVLGVGLIVVGIQVCLVLFVDVVCLYFEKGEGYGYFFYLYVFGVRCVFVLEEIIRKVRDDESIQVLVYFDNIYLFYLIRIKSLFL